MKPDEEIEEPIDFFFNTIESFIPYRDEFISVIDIVSKSKHGDDSISPIHKFFEKVITYFNQATNGLKYWNFIEYVYNFITYELFSYTIAVLVRNERYEEIDYLLKEGYYVEHNRSGSKSMQRFNIGG